MPRISKKAAAEKLVTPEERYRMVQVTAYLLAEKDQFATDPIRYWLDAEAEVDAQLGKLK